MQTHANTKTVPATTMSGNKSANNKSNARDREQLRISGNEIMLIADVANGTMYSPKSGWIMTVADLSAFQHEIQDADEYYKVGDKWGVSIGDLLFKFERMPAASMIEIFNHIAEAWAFHKHDFGNFLISRQFVFSPASEDEVEQSYLLAPRLASGEIVVNRQPSHAKPCDYQLIIHALARVTSSGRKFIEEEVGFPGEIGFTTCLETNGGDDIVFAQRKNRSGLTRFVRGKSPIRSKSVTVVLMRKTDQKFVLITGFVGCKPEPEPWDSNSFESKPNPATASAQSRAFWAGHALVWDERNIIPGTETTIAPACF
ncbi:MAG: hypothetical protein ACOYM3_11950 [Terrimicrobiaceae bacterium]